jgi:metal-responsive CopG/Arc/MetJ family transcriptional regulator
MSSGVRCYRLAAALRDNLEKPGHEGGHDMERLTISMSNEFASELALFMATNHYENRSEAIRDLARQGLRQAHLYNGVAGECVATLSYVFNHDT